MPQESVKRDVAPIAEGITKEMQKYRDDLMELVNYKEDILEMLKYHKDNINVINVAQLDMDSLPKEYKSIIVNKSIKVYEPVYELFNTLCESYESRTRNKI